MIASKKKGFALIPRDEIMYSGMKKEIRGRKKLRTKN
jgi:hypothetical protein